MTESSVQMFKSPDDIDVSYIGLTSMTDIHDSTTTTVRWDTVAAHNGVSQDDYEKDLKRRQEEHLRRVSEFQAPTPFQPCTHDSCPECVGTGVKIDGSQCIHMIYCGCPKCSPTF